MSPQPARLPSTPSCVCVRACADTLLAQGGLWENPYFEALRDGRMSLEAFRASQEQFYFAVVFFPRPLAGLIARSPDYASRIDILHNVVEEHGDFHVCPSPSASFESLLPSLWSTLQRL